MKRNLFELLKRPLLFLQELEATLKSTHLKRETLIFYIQIENDLICQSL